MTYYGANELAASFRTVRKNTIKIAEEIPAEQYSFRAAPDTRSVAETLVHIALSPRLQRRVQGDRLRTLVGFDFMGFFGKLIAEEKEPRSKEEIVDLLRTEGDKFAQMLDGVNEEFLGEQVESVPGFNQPNRSRFEMLLGVKEHEMHHRGQLMLIERMLGMTPHLTRDMQARMAAMNAAPAGR
jgi:uncharacterized damage-inducible protein DinB